METTLTAGLALFLAAVVVLCYTVPGRPPKDAGVIVESSRRLCWHNGGGITLGVTRVQPGDAAPWLPLLAQELAQTHTVFAIEIVIKGSGNALHTRLAYEACLSDESGREYRLCNAAVAQAHRGTRLADTLLALSGTVSGSGTRRTGLLLFEPAPAHLSLRLVLPQLFEPFTDVFQVCVLEFAPVAPAPATAEATPILHSASEGAR